MTMMVGNGPFARTPAGEFNFTDDRPAHVLYFEDTPKRVRAVIAGEVIAESVHAKILHETGIMPVYYFPEADVCVELMTPTDTSTHCPFKGDASYWSLEVDGTTIEDAMWGYPEPLERAPDLAGYRAFAWDTVDEWYEESEQIFVHPRDPYHRLDVIASDRHVVVKVDGEVVAESKRPTMLFESGLPPRFYLPVEDVLSDLLTPTDTTSECPYKGTARYWNVAVGDEVHEDIVWGYDKALREVAPIEGLMCFYNEKVDLEIDGEAWERVVTKFS